MDIGISSAVFYPMETEKAVDTIINLGFKRIELFINSESEYSDIYINELSNKLTENNVEVVSVHPYTSVIEAMLFFSGYKRRLDESIELYERYFKAAAKLGAKYFIFHGDRSLVASKIPGDDYYTVFDRLCDTALKHNILICQENVSWCQSREPEYIFNLRERLGERIGFTLDMKQARRAGVDIDDYASAMGDNLKVIHVSDFNEDNSCLLPGFGKENYQLFLKKYFEKYLIIEVYSTNYDNIQQIASSKFLLEHHFFGY